MRMAMGMILTVRMMEGMVVIVSMFMFMFVIVIVIVIVMRIILHK